MTADDRIRQLLQRALDSGLPLSEVCADDPEMLPAVAERLRQCQDVEQEVERIFPSPAPKATASAPRPAVGERLPAIPGHDVQAVLGRGGMGIVYRARHQKLNRAVAVKMLLGGAYAGPQEVARFAREAEAVAGLCHEHIVQLHDVGELEGRPYFTMELVEGGSLAQKLLQSGGSLPPREAAQLLVKVAHAVQVAHESGVVHRDLKPGNILLTREGVPKIADFGLARRLGGDEALTLSGARIGTPSYMAPEQAVGKAGAAGPLVDVYALGAILYEMLTGRPPFVGATHGETERRLLSDEPVPPSRLRAAIPRDLETICLKCLQKDPQRRYGTPSALADDLDRFLRGEPVAARPAGFAERAVRWVRRRPSEAALIAGGVLVAFALLSAGLQMGFQRSAVALAVEDDLREVSRREDAADWTEARTALERAKARLGGGGATALCDRVTRAEADLVLVARLGKVLLRRAAVVGGRFDVRNNKARADREYESAFIDAGLGSFDTDPGVVAERVASSQVRSALVASLDDWAACAGNDSRRRWILGVSRLADRPVTVLRDRLRDSAAWNDRNALREVADLALGEGASVQMLVSLGDRLQELGGDVAPYLKRVQREHPGDFWANFAFAETLRRQRSTEACRYFQAAIACNPGAAVAYNNLGLTLVEQGRADDAIEQFRMALRIDGTFVPAHNNLGIALLEKGHVDEAISHYSRALDSDANDAGTQNNMGLALVRRGQVDLAIAHYRRAVELDADNGPAHNNLGLALRSVGRLEEAVSEFGEAIRVSKDDAAAHNNLGIVLRDLNRLNEAIDHFLHALRVDPNFAAAHSNLGIAYAMSGKPDGAIEHYLRALQLNESDGDTHNNLGLALAGKGRLDEAIEHYRQAVRITPGDGPAHNNLGMALKAKGLYAEAADHFREVLRLTPGDTGARDNLAASIAERDRSINGAAK